MCRRLKLKTRLILRVSDRHLESLIWKHIQIMSNPSWKSWTELSTPRMHSQSWSELSFVMVLQCFSLNTSKYSLLSSSNAVEPNLFLPGIQHSAHGVSKTLGFNGAGKRQVASDVFGQNVLGAGHLERLKCKRNHDFPFPIMKRNHSYPFPILKPFTKHS